MISRSFKYHRPRSVLTMAGQDANTLVQVGDEPNCLADKRRIAPGLKVEGQNYVGSFEDDKGRFTELVERFLPVGFYYKTFHEQKNSWKAWEPIIRAHGRPRQGSTSRPTSTTPTTTSSTCSPMSR